MFFPGSEYLKKNIQDNEIKGFVKIMKILMCGDRGGEGQEILLVFSRGWGYCINILLEWSSNVILKIAATSLTLK